MSLIALTKFNVRYYRRHTLLALLCLTGISLGVGIVVAVKLINNSALESFSSSIDFLSGKSNQSIISAYGRIDEKVFPDIWKNPAIKAAAPIIEAIATAEEIGSEPLRFLGVDPFLDKNIRSFFTRKLG